MIDNFITWLRGIPNTNAPTQVKAARQSLTSFLGFPATPDYADADAPDAESPALLSDAEIEADTTDSPDTSEERDSGHDSDA